MTRTARRGPSSARRAGMSLLEVLLAMAVFLVSLTGIAQLIDAGSNAASDGILQNVGTRLAQSKLAEAEAGVVSPASGGSGTFDDEPDWQWTVASSPAAVPNLYDVTVTVSREVRGKRIEVTLSQMVLDPAATGTAAEAQAPTTSTSGASSGSSTSSSGGTGS